MSRSSRSPSSSESKSNSNAKLSELPLLDEVNELLEKEKLLLGLKVIEQQREAQEWKKKYDLLLGKVSETGDMRLLNTAAVIGGASSEAINDDENTNYNTNNSSSSSSSSSGSSSNNKSSSGAQRRSIMSKKSIVEIVTEILMTSGSNWVLDLSNKLLSNSSLTLLLKGPTSLTHSNPDLSVFNFSRCGLKEEHYTSLGAIITKPNIMSIDLSHNLLGRGFEQELFVALKVN